MVTVAPSTVAPSFVTVTATSAFFVSAIWAGFTEVPATPTVRVSVFSAYLAATVFTPVYLTPPTR